MSIRLGGARAFFGTNAAARRLRLGSNLSTTIWARHLQIDPRPAFRSFEEFQRHFVIPALPAQFVRLIGLLVINDPSWTLFVHRHDFIADGYVEQERRAGEALSSTLLPEHQTLQHKTSLVR